MLAVMKLNTILWTLGLSLWHPLWHPHGSIINAVSTVFRSKKLGCCLISRHGSRPLLVIRPIRWEAVGLNLERISSTNIFCVMLGRTLSGKTCRAELWGMLHKMLHWHLQSLEGMFNGLWLVALHKSMGTTSQENSFSKSQVIDDNLKLKQSSQIEMLFHSR
jgi:hypothetical protein